MKETSIFAQIINGELPCHKVYEDDRTFAFLDIYPIQTGQVLVVPKKQVSFAWDLDDEDYHALMSTVKKVALRLRDVFPDRARVGTMIEGLDVANHAHVKVFSFDVASEYRRIPDMSIEPDHAALAKLAEEIRF